MKTASYNHILKYTGLLGGVQALYIVMAVLRNKLTALLVGAVGMGLADLYSRAVELLSNASNLGLYMSGARTLAGLCGEGRWRAVRHGVCLLRTWVAYAAALGALLTVAVSPLMSRFATGDYGATAAFALLAPAVALSVLTGGEMAVLKGCGRLRRLAQASAGGAVCTLLVAVPLYWWLGLRGVIPVITAVAAATFLIYLRAATRECPYRIAPLHRRFVSRGVPLLRLGLAYVVAGVMASGAEMAVRSGLMNSGGGLKTVGLYAAGLTLTVSYVRILFMSMDADYFPRLSGLVHDCRRMNLTVNRQTDVLVAFAAPFLILFALALPLLVRLLYTAEFMAVVPMALCAVGFMFFKALYTPIAYLPLAAGHGTVFVVMELIYNVLFALSVIAGARWGGLAGAGAGLALSGAINLAMLWAVYARRYGFRLRVATLRRSAGLLLCLTAGLAAAAQTDLSVRLAGGIAACLPACLPAWHLLRRQTAAGNAWRNLLHRRKH